MVLRHGEQLLVLASVRGHNDNGGCVPDAVAPRGDRDHVQRLRLPFRDPRDRLLHRGQSEIHLHHLDQEGPRTRLPLGVRISAVSRCRYVRVVS